MVQLGLNLNIQTEFSMHLISFDEQLIFHDWMIIAGHKMAKKNTEFMITEFMKGSKVTPVSWWRNWDEASSSSWQKNMERCICFTKKQQNADSYWSHRHETVKIQPCKLWGEIRKDWLHDEKPSHQHTHSVPHSSQLTVFYYNDSRKMASENLFHLPDGGNCS